MSVLMDSMTSSRAPRPRNAHAARGLAFLADEVGDARDLGRLGLLELDHVVEGLGNFAVDAREVERHARPKSPRLNERSAFRSSPRSSIIWSPAWMESIALF